MHVTKSTREMQCSHLVRKWLGVVWLMIEVNLVGGSIFGFPALFKILPQYGIYGSNEYCSSLRLINETVSTSSKLSCEAYQTRQYQNALTTGIILFEIPAAIIGPLIDRFGCRFVKLIAILFHIIGWLSLALAAPGRDALIYVHTSFSSLAGIIVLLTAYASSDYFSKARALVSALFAGVCTSATIWYSIFQILVDARRISLQSLSFIWMSIGAMILISSFLFLDWSFPILNLPYKFNTKLDEKTLPPIDNRDESVSPTKWYTRVLERKGVWFHLTDPLYILVVLFLSFLLLQGIFRAVTWYPWVYQITNENTQLTNTYTLVLNFSAVSAIIICPIIGFLLGFNANNSKKQKLLNIALVQTAAWLVNLVACIVNMFPQRRMVIPALILNCFSRATIAGGTQAVIATFFPSEYIGTLTGVMWTIAGAITALQYGLIQLTNEVFLSWRAWLIILLLIIVMSCHLFQLWWKYIQEVRSKLKIASEEQITDAF